jgi:hypothetical protein
VTDPPDERCAFCAEQATCFSAARACFSAGIRLFTPNVRGFRDPVFGLYRSVRPVAAVGHVAFCWYFGRSYLRTAALRLRWSSSAMRNATFCLQRYSVLRDIPSCAASVVSLTPASARSRATCICSTTSGRLPHRLDVFIRTLSELWDIFSSFHGGVRAAWGRFQRDGPLAPVTLRQEEAAG